MKTLIATIIIVFCVNYVNAQNYYKKDKVSSGKEIYNCILLGSGQRIYLTNTKNRFFNRKMIIPNGVESLSSINVELPRKKMGTIFNEIISAADREKLKSKKEIISIEFLISDSGEVQELNFDITKNSSINPLYLSRIEQRVKKEVVFTFSSNELKGANFIRFSLTFMY